MFYSERASLAPLPSSREIAWTIAASLVNVRYCVMCVAADESLWRLRCGMCLIVVDTFLLPVTMAWDLERLGPSASKSASFR